MNIEIRYLSYSGNTKRIADAIGESIQIPADDLAIKVPTNTDILFLGCAVYGFEIDPEVIEFINTLEVRKVAIFSTSAISKMAAKKIKKLLAKKQIAYFDETYYCKGHYKFLNKERPNLQDVNAAKRFAKRIMKEGL